MTTETPYKVLYHVFTDNLDEWYSEAEIKQAEAQYEEWVKEYGNVRLYEETYETGEDYKNAINVREECLMSSGDYPQ